MTFATNADMPDLPVVYDLDEYVGYEAVPMPLSWRIENWLYDLYCDLVNWIRYQDEDDPTGAKRMMGLTDKYNHGGTVPSTEPYEFDLKAAMEIMHRTNQKMHQAEQDDMWRKPANRLPTNTLIPQRPMGLTQTTLAADYKYVVGKGWVNRNKIHLTRTGR